LISDLEKLNRKDLAPSIQKLKADGLKIDPDKLDPDLWFLKPATRKQVQYVYMLGGLVGYDSDQVHDWHPSHMNRIEIDDLIRRLQIEGGTEETDEQREHRYRRDGLY